MADLTLRNVKGSPLTNQEVDDNFSNLNTDKYESGDSATFSDVTLSGMVGSVSWNSVDGALDVPLDADVTLQVGQEFVFYAKATEAIANGDAVMFDGAQGDHVLIRKCDMASVGFDTTHILGVATQAFDNNEFGYVTSIGKVRGLNTSAYAEGTILYVSPTVAGALTSTNPSGTGHVVQAAAVLRSHATQGVILVRLTHISELGELDGVAITNVSTGQYLTYNGSSWVNTTLDTTNWDTAYGWGNHASVGYLTSASLTGYATQTYVNTAVSNLVDSAPATLDTLNELAAALGDDPNFATTVTNSIATKLPLAGGTLTGNLNFGDNVKANFGAGSDLQIYHDGTHSYISDQGTGRLVLNSSGGSVRIEKSPTENMAIFSPDGNCELFYDNSLKLATTATGIDVTGTVVADGLTVSGAQNSKVAYFDDSSEAGYRQLQFTSSTNGQYWDINSQGTSGGLGGVLTLSTRSIDRMEINTGGDISFYEDTGTTAKFSWSSANETISIGTGASSTATISAYSRTVSASLPSALRIIENTGASSYWDIGSTGGASNNLNFYANANTTPKVTFTGAGNVGIGVTPNASARLHVGKSGGSPELWLERTDGYLPIKLIGNTLGNGQGFKINVAGTDALAIDSSGNVGIGVSTPSNNHANANNLVVGNGTAGGIANYVGTGLGWYAFSRANANNSDAYDGGISYDGSRNLMFHTNAGAERMRIDGAGNLLVGDTSTVPFDGTSGVLIGGARTSLAFATTGHTHKMLYSVNTGTAGLHFYDSTNNRTDMIWDNSGNLLVGTTDTFPGGGDTNTGVSLTNSGAVVASRDGDFAARFNRKTSDGEIIGLNKDGVPVGTIGARGGDVYLETGTTGILMYDAQDAIIPVQSTGIARDAAINLGISNIRFKDLYLSGNVALTTLNGGTPWHSGNDGSGSGLDADLLDGNHASSFLTTTFDSQQIGHFGEVIYNNGSARISSDPRINSGGYDGDNLNIHWYSTTASGGNYGRVGHALYNGSAYQYLHTKDSSNNIHINNNVIWHAGNDGSGSGLDADLLDGWDSGHYTAANAGTFQGDWNTIFNTATAYTTGIYEVHAITSGAHSNYPSGVYTYGGVFAWRLANSTFKLYASHTGDLAYQTGWSNDGYSGWRNVLTGNNIGSYAWTSSNDGSGSGLDADLLDGIDSGSFLRSDADDTASGQYLFSKVNDHAIQIGTIRGLAVGSQGGQFIQLYERVNIGGPAGWGESSTTAAPSYGLSTYGGASLATHTGAVTISGNTAWHAGNDGSGSGLDADLLDGLQLHTGVNNEVNKVVRTDSNGYIHAGWINTISGQNTTEIPSRFYASDDAYLRYYDLSHARAWMGTSGKTSVRSRIQDNTSEAYRTGSQGYGANNLNDFYNRGSCFVDVWTDGLTGAPPGNHWNGFQALHYSASNTYHHGMRLLMASGNPANTYLQGWWANGGSGYAAQKIWTDGNDGSGSGLDADLLDGIDSGSFLRSDVNDTATGSITFDQASQYFRKNSQTNYVSASLLAESYGGGTSITGVGFHISGSIGKWVNMDASGVLRWDSDTFWHSGNDGSGSGLDADTVDGWQASNIVKGSSGKGTTNAAFGSTANSDSGFYDVHNDGTPTGTWYSMVNMAHYGGNHGHQIAGSFYSAGDLYNRNNSNTSLSAWAKIWNTANDGSGSGLDADLLDGYNSDNFLGKFGNTYYQANNWIQLSGGNGLYCPQINNAHFTPNATGSYGTWNIIGSRGDYTGIYLAHSGVNIGMYDSGGNGGDYHEASGKWSHYWHRGNTCLGINASTTSAAYSLYVTGAIYATDNITAYSDRRVKENIRTIDNALETVEQMRGVYYNRIDDEEKKTVIGFIAQEVDEVEGAKPLVTYAADVDQYGVSYGNATALLVEAIKELSQQVKDLQKEIKELKND